MECFDCLEELSCGEIAHSQPNNKRYENYKSLVKYFCKECWDWRTMSKSISKIANKVN